MLNKKIISAVIALELVVCSWGFQLSAEDYTENLTADSVVSEATYDIPHGSVMIEESTFPCSYFRMYLLQFYQHNYYIDSLNNYHPYITPEQLAKVTKIYISLNEPDYNYDVQDLTGIEYFPELTSLVVRGNPPFGFDITNIDVSSL